MPSQTQIAFDQNTLYTRYDSPGGSVSYYGYSNPGVNDNSTVFSIKKVYYVGSIQYVDWSNNIIGNYEASWTNRTYYFATPSSISIAVTASINDNSNSYNLTFNWNTATGSSRYNITVFKNNVPVTNILDVSSTQYNQGLKNASFTLINNNNLTINNCLSGSTYSIMIYPYNGIAQGATAYTSLHL